MRFTYIGAETITTRYFHTDHLGSISVITDENGTVVERLSYDPWGKRRFANGADDPSGSISSQTTRGFSGQEELDTIGLVHMNGRVYDPMLGRMLSADPTIPDALNAQAWNRYSYVGNDPLTFTDPNGYSWLSQAFHAVTTFFSHVLANPIVRAVAQIALTFILGPVAIGLEAVAFAAASAAIITGLTGGNLGQILRAGAIAGATALAFNFIGTATLGPAHASPFDSHGNLINPGGYAANIAGHAGVGCLTAVASGGKCGPGALSGAAGAAATPLIGLQFRDPLHNLGDYVGGLAATSAVGGLASVAGGGKFADGAVTAAFGYMFNATAHLGGSFEIPGFISSAITATYGWLTGNTSWVMGNGAAVGFVVQYPSSAAGDQSTRYDFGMYGQVSAPNAAVEVPNFNYNISTELGIGTGTIHGTFDGRSYSYNFMAGTLGGTATFNDQSVVTGFTMRAGSGAGISANTSITGAYTVRDFMNYWTDK